MHAHKRYLYRKTVNGRTYLFFRYQGKLTPLPADENSIEFRRAYAALLRATVQTAPTAPRGRAAANARAAAVAERAAVVAAGADTLNAAIDLYLDSAAYAKLAPTTKLQYQHTLKTLRARLGAAHMIDIDDYAIDIYTDQLAKQHGTSVADRHKAMISNIWQAVRKFPQFALRGRSNPTLNTDKHYTVQRAHRPWPDAVQAAFMAGAAPHLQLAKLLLHFSLQRGCDAVKMLWADYDGAGLTVRQQKTHGEVAALPDYYICAKPLREALDRELHCGRPLAATILTNAHGRPYGNSAVLSHAIKRELVRLGLATDGERTFTMHGLRKTGAKEIAELAVGAAGIKAVGGWKTDSEANYYAQDAERRRINARTVAQWDEALAAQERAAAVKIRRAALKEV